MSNGAQQTPNKEQKSDSVEILKMNAKKIYTYTPHAHLQHSAHICSEPLFSGAIFLTTPSGEATKGFGRSYY